MRSADTFCDNVGALQRCGQVLAILDVRRVAFDSSPALRVGEGFMPHEPKTKPTDANVAAFISSSPNPWVRLTAPRFECAAASRRLSGAAPTCASRSADRLRRFSANAAEVWKAQMLALLFGPD